MKRFYDGLLKLAAEYETPLAGGDLAESAVVLADVVLVGGVARGTALRRSGARAGDAIYVTGELEGRRRGWNGLAVRSSWIVDRGPWIVVRDRQCRRRAEAGMRNYCVRICIHSQGSRRDCGCGGEARRPRRLI